MAQITGFTSTRMLAIENGTVVSGTVNGSGDLILTRYDGTTVNAGPVIGPTGPPGTAVVQEAPTDSQHYVRRNGVWIALPAYPTATTQVFIASGTWTKPAGAKVINAIVFGGGANGSTSGDYGGGGGMRAEVWLIASQLAATESVVVASAGGTSVFAGKIRAFGGLGNNSTGGGIGSNIGKFEPAVGSMGGGNGNSGAAGNSSENGGAAGGLIGTGFTNGMNGGSSMYGGPGGGSGGNSQSFGTATGGQGGTIGVITSGGGGSAGPGGGSGGAGISRSGSGFAGDGGGGSGMNISGVSGTGGAGGIPAGGGGGSVSAAGGAGGRGEIIIITYF